MADNRKFLLPGQPPEQTKRFSPRAESADISQILQEARKRWLRPTEICEILSNYKHFAIAAEPPNRPISGSLFLFDRKVLRYFRKDGHDWRKKKDGKTVKEAHEKLKAGSIDVLHCYYAHGEQNENFQRRTYWLLEEDFTHIVLVHYLEVQVHSINIPATFSHISSFPVCFLVGDLFNYAPSFSVSKAKFGAADNFRASSRYHPLAEMQQPVDGFITENMLYPSSSTVGSRQGKNHSLCYHGEMLPTTSNIDNHSFSHHDIARMFNDTNSGLSSTSRILFDSMPFNEPCTDFSTGFTEPTLHSSFACLEVNNLEDSSCLRTFTSEALYTNHLSKKEADALSFTGMPPSEVSVTGTFLVNKKHVENRKWSCMFGNVEVPAQVLTDGTLRCYAPAHQSGRVPFYITCSNRVACSEVREFEYRDPDAQYMEASCSQANSVNEMHLHIRLEKLLTLEPDDHHMLVLSSGNEKYEVMNAINSLMLDVKWSDQESASANEVVSTARDQSLKKLVKEKLHHWLICRINDDAKGPNVLCKEGQGVIHLVAALGYDWAISPIIVAGVNVNFRDAHGWTALHWAASLGRERTIGVLITNGAAAGALTDPTSEFPSGRSPSDLASVNGHKGIAGFLAESALTSHLEALTIRESKDSSSTAEVCELPAVEDLTGNSSAQFAGEDYHAESLQGSLSAVRKSTQAAARIFQAFRVESFHRKKVVEYGDDDCGLSDERTLSLVSLKNVKPGQHDTHLHSAAVRIQNKFRGWKGRKEFMIIRQRIVKLQAHVRGHQVRKSYRKVIWSIGIVEKVILRWRRKRPGLRGFRLEKQIEGPSQIQPTKAEDEYDFLHDGRRQAEDRLQRSLARVHSMSQYPEAREQYHRLTTCVAELKQSRIIQDEMLSEPGGGDANDFMAGLEDLICIDDAAMSAIW
nr:unnamed protein product [Digitaria exilis]